LQGDAEKVGSASSAKEPSVTEVLAFLVRPGAEREAEQWQAQAAAAAESFAGFVSAARICPVDDSRFETALVLRFSSYEGLRAWLASEVRETLLRERASLGLSAGERRVLAGLEGWTLLPRRSAPASRVKLSVLSCAAIYPQVHGFDWIVRWVVPGLPVWLHSLLVTALISVATTYAVMPWLTGVFSGWLYPQGRAS
jgi:hypothetical protein